MGCHPNTSRCESTGIAPTRPPWPAGSPRSPPPTRLLPPARSLFPFTPAKDNLPARLRPSLLTHVCHLGCVRLALVSRLLAPALIARCLRPTVPLAAVLKPGPLGESSLSLTLPKGVQGLFLALGASLPQILPRFSAHKKPPSLSDKTLSE